MTLTHENLLPFIHDYFSSIGLQKLATSYFNNRTFSAATVFCLPDVCLVKKNKPQGKGNQTHIHVTGNARYFFFSLNDFKDIEHSSLDTKQDLILSRTNIEHLKKLNSQQDIASSEFVYEKLNLIETFTHKKIAFRHGQNPQVQISKIRLDGKDFIDLRDELHTHDLLIFLKYRDLNSFFVLGIPKSFYEKTFELSGINYFEHLESPNAINLKKALKNIGESIETDKIVSSSDNIEDLIYQQLVDEADSELELEENYTAEKYIGSNDPKAVTSNRPNTNPRLGKAVIKHNAYRCAFDSEDESHKTFLKPDGTLYMEVHHLIPLEQQSHFENKLDTKANLVPVCPLCHRLLHYGCKVEIDKLLTELYNERQEVLKQSGLDIALDELKSYY